MFFFARYVLHQKADGRTLVWPGESQVVVGFDRVQHTVQVQTRPCRCGIMISFGSLSFRSSFRLILEPTPQSTQQTTIHSFHFTLIWLPSLASSLWAVGSLVPYPKSFARICQDGGQTKDRGCPSGVGKTWLRVWRTVCRSIYTSSYLLNPY